MRYDTDTHADEVLPSVRELLQKDLPFYTDSLRRAFSSCDAVFTRAGYAEFFWHCASTVPGWLPLVVLANARAESKGSAKLLRLWEGTHSNEKVEKQVLVHAKDESRHSRVFLRLVNLVFPKAVDPAVTLSLDSDLPDIRRVEHRKAERCLSEDALIDHLVQMNIGEIRTRLHMHLLAPVLYAFAPAESKDEVKRILISLERDEVRHIAYTADLMEDWAGHGDANYIERLYVERLRQFHLITLEETESAASAYGGGLFPDLLEI